MEEQAESPPLLNITKAAKRLGVDRKTVYRWILNGDIAVVKMGGRRWVPGAEIERVLRAKEENR